MYDEQWVVDNEHSLRVMGLFLTSFSCVVLCVSFFGCYIGWRFDPSRSVSTGIKKAP